MSLENPTLLETEFYYRFVQSGRFFQAIKGVTECGAWYAWVAVIT